MNTNFMRNQFSLVSDIDVQKNIFFFINNLFSQAAVWECSSKWVFLKILQYLELKRGSNTGIFL